MYFLQEAGQPLRLTYAKGRYGPYADNLNHVLQALEGHYLRGYGDRTQRILDLSPIMLIDGADGEARQWLKASADDADSPPNRRRCQADHRLRLTLRRRTARHRPLDRDPRNTRHRSAALTAAVHAWSPRKERLFTEHHVSVAADRLRALSWLHA